MVDHTLLVLLLLFTLLSEVHVIRYSFDYISISSNKDFLKADPNCPGNVVTAFAAIEKLKNQGSRGLAELSEIFKLCKSLESTEQIPHMLRWIRYAFTTLAMCDYPYSTNFLAPLPGHPVNVACETMSSASSKLKGLFEVTAMVYNGTNGTLSCLDPDKEFIDCADSTGCGLGPDSLAQDYQTCTESPVLAGSNNKTDMFPPLPWTPDMRAQHCQEKWGVTQRPGWLVTQLWGKDISSASNIIFSNGDLDPWRPGGVLRDVSPTLVAVLVKGGAHHLDLRASNPKDPPTVKQAREQELELIRQFISG